MTIEKQFQNAVGQTACGLATKAGAEYLPIERVQVSIDNLKDIITALESLEYDLTNVPLDAVPIKDRTLSGLSYIDTIREAPDLLVRVREDILSRIDVIRRNLFSNN